MVHRRISVRRLKANAAGTFSRRCARSRDFGLAGVLIMRIMRVICLLLAAIACVSIPAWPPAFGEGIKKPPEDPKLRTAIANGIEYLVKVQDKNTGAMEGQNYFQLAATSLAGMAFLSGGNLPGRGQYCRNVEMALNFILENALTPSGYIQYYNSNMYSHGFATLFLAEAYGTLPANSQLGQKVYKALKKSVQLMEKCQTEEGGWWYNPLKDSGPNGADISVTVCETNALRAARNCGIAVDKRVIEKALNCVKAAHNDDGGFSYRIGMNGVMFGGGGSAFPRSCGAVCILQALGAYDSLEAKQGLDYITAKGLPTPESMNGSGVSYYSIYYFAQAMFMAGSDYWAEWWPKLREHLLAKQDTDGSWLGEGGEAYGTAIALIVLQMPYRYLPIYQEGIEGPKTPGSE